MHTRLRTNLSATWISCSAPSSLRPYVFGFLAAFLLAGGRGPRLAPDAAVRGLGLAAGLARRSSRRRAPAFPFGLYHYTGTTRGQELFIADVPLMDSPVVHLPGLCGVLPGPGGAAAPRASPAAAVALASGVLMMLLDVVIDPIAVRGDRWFLGPHLLLPGWWRVLRRAAVATSLGWLVLGAVGVGGYVV